MWSYLWCFAEALLENPLPLMTLLAVIVVLYGGGTSFGLPLLFWHENPWKQMLAGGATTWLAAEVLFVIFLLSGDDPENLVRFFAIGAGAFGLTVGIRAAVVESRFLIQRGGTSRMSSSRPGLSPAIREVKDGGTPEMAAVQISSIPFMAGALVAAGVTAFLISEQDALNASIGFPLSTFLAPLLLREMDAPGLHGIAATFFVIFIAVLMALAWLVPTRFRTPALDICVMLAAVAAAYGFLAFHLELPGLIGIVIVGLVGFGGLNRHKVRVPALAQYETDRQRYPPKLLKREGSSEEHEGGKVSPRSPFRFRSDGAGLPALGGEKPSPLILLSVSGGGVRAAAWTAAILAKLDECREFRSAARLVAGSSGGMMGAASWVGSLHAASESGAPPALGWKSLVERVARDSLSEVTRQLVYRDLPYVFLPWANLRDRGWAMEQAWKRHLEGALDSTLEELEAGERRGWWPSLVFSPMLVEDGRRFLITNMDMQSVSKNEVVWLSSSGSALEQSSVSSYHIADLFPDAWREFPLSTAARLSAAFAYVSPAAVLPTDPRRRIVDAGYYDNYGVDLVTGWLREAVTRPETRSWLQEQVSRILVVQIRDTVSELAVNPPDDAVPSVEPGPLAVGLEGVTTPISAVLSARESVMLFRNDGQLEAVTKLYRKLMSPEFLETTIFELEGEASLSWYLTEAEIEVIKTHACSEGIRAKLQRVNQWLTR